MKRAWSPMVVVALALASAGLFQAQGAGKGFKFDLSAQGPSGLGATTTPQKTLAVTTDDPSTAVQVVIRFLELRPDQVEAFLRLLQARQEALAPLLAAITEREKALNELLESGGSPSDIGQLVIEIHALRRQVIQVQAGFIANWENLLDPEQRQRWEAVRVAARLQPIVPAFQQLDLL